MDYAKEKHEGNIENVCEIVTFGTRFCSNKM